MPVRKAVIPAAGFGTRFLPATKSIPKVMIPVLGQPAIHFAVEEAANAGIEHVVLIVSPGQEAVWKYFERTPALEEALERRENETLLNQMIGIAEMADVSHVVQENQLGLGHAVLMAKDFIGNEPFAVFLPDDLIYSDAPTIGRMIEVFEQYGGSVIAVKEVPDEAVPNLGIIDPRPISETVSQVLGMVEKPSLGEAPSNLAIIGRYLLPPEVFEALENVTPGAVGEIQLTDGIAALLPVQKAYGYRFPGVHFDLGTPPGLLKASVYAALQTENISGDFRAWLEGVL